MKQIPEFYRNRFKQKEYIYRNRIWQVLCEHVFQKMVNEKDTLMDIGAGYCEFINNIKCQVKIAVDINPDTKLRAKEDIEVLNINIFSIPQTYNGKIDVVFMSNFLEHLSSKEEVISVLERSYRLLKSGGKIILMQPNIDLVKERYWDFIDHTVPLNLPSLTEALESTGFKMDSVIKKFLPYTTKNKLSSYTVPLLRLYLLLPSSIRPFAGQSLLVAKKRD